jgi:hypothetical protein
MKLAANRIASYVASAELMFVPRLFVRPISLPRRHAMQAAIPVGVPSLSFGFEP